ncbi:MAG: HEAT repeat domain-containing protein [Candidatus Heimdallarchaeota archaeon]
MRNNKKLINQLLEKSKSRDKEIRENAVKKLGILNDSRAIDPLIELVMSIQSEDEFFIRVIIDSLALFGDLVVEPLIKVLSFMGDVLLEDATFYIFDKFPAISTKVLIECLKLSDFKDDETFLIRAIPLLVYLSPEKTHLESIKPLLDSILISDYDEFQLKENTRELLSKLTSL